MAFCKQKAFSHSSRDPFLIPDFNSPIRCHFPRFYCDVLQYFHSPGRLSAQPLADDFEFKHGL